jgi:hypothetical protein
MADQGKTCITMTVPASTARGLAISGAGTLSATLRAVGVLYDSTIAGETTGNVQIAGTALATFGGNVTAGAPLKSDATGKLVVATTGAANDDHLICATAMEAGAANELRRVRII